MQRKRCGGQHRTGGKQNQPFQFSLNASFEAGFQASRFTSDGGLIFVRERDERSGLGQLIAQQLTDSRRRKNTQLPLAGLLRPPVYNRIAGYEDVNDAERLSQDPTFRLTSLFQRRNTNNHWKPTSLIFLVLQFTSSALWISSASAQDKTTSQTGTRTELLEEQQEEKARNLLPARPDKAEQALDKYVGEDPLNKYMGGLPGLHLSFGGIPSGAGFGLGPEYFRPDLAKGQMSFRAFAVGTKKQWYLVETELRFPHLARRYLDLGFEGRRLDANSFDYYGPGPDSHEEGRSDYRREESTLDFSLVLRPARRHLSIGFAAGYLWLNVGPGQSSLFTSSEQQYPASMAPGIDRQTNYLRAGPCLEVDSRDKPKDPHGGTHFLAKFNQFGDGKYDQYSFRQIDASIEQYLPFFNQKRLIALRARSVLSYPCAGSAVPFYMQPTLGGPSDLRYRRYRFYDNNTFLLNAEYRWEVFTLMDAALFADAGEVFHRVGDFNANKLESDVGFGFRFKTRRAVVFRIDTALSHEGIGIWFVFDPVF